MHNDIQESSFFPSLSNTPAVFAVVVLFNVFLILGGITSSVDVTSPGCGPNLANIPEPIV